MSVESSTRTVDGVVAVPPEDRRDLIEATVLRMLRLHEDAAAASARSDDLGIERTGATHVSFAASSSVHSSRVFVLKRPWRLADLVLLRVVVLVPWYSG